MVRTRAAGAEAGPEELARKKWFGKNVLANLRRRGAAPFPGQEAMSERTVERLGGNLLRNRVRRERGSEEHESDFQRHRTVNYRLAHLLKPDRFPPI